MLSEHRLQACVIEWASLKAKQCPELALIFAIPNGGLRDVRVARKLKLEGVKPGVPDLFLPVSRGDFHGLFIEMKTLNGRVSAEQTAWLVKLKDQGFKTLVCRSFESAVNEISRYLGIDSGLDD